MSVFKTIVISVSLSTLSLWGAEPPADFDKNWPQWRGPHANGVAPDANPPVEWSENKNVKWKVSLPGKGHATPIVWGNHVFVLTAAETARAGDEIESGQAEASTSASVGRRRGGWRPPSATTSNVHRFMILAIRRDNGKIAWQKTAREEMPHEGTHATASWASSSPVTDGEHVYAFFGSRGLYCYDLNGNLKWEKDLGDMNIKLAFGEGSSPALHDDKIVINWDHEGQSFVVALNKSTGEEVWRVDRDERTSWSTPLIVEHGGQAQVITSATSRVRSYDLATGELLWESSGMTANVIPTPVYRDGLVYVMSGFRGNALQAIRLSAAEGNVKGSAAIAWTLDRDTPYTPSPLLYEDKLYFLKSNDGILACFDAKTGEEYYSRKRLEGIEGVYASPVAAQDRIYVVGRNGVSTVIKHGSEFQVLATNTLDASFDASPAIVGNEIFLRGHKSLYCIASE